MRYHYERSERLLSVYGTPYICDHPVYSVCTLFTIGKRGLAVIQQHYRPYDKCTWWGEIDEDLRDALYLHPGFLTFFEARAGLPANGLYPTVTVRQIMWALKMKPLKKEPWETVFDRRDI